MPALEFIARWVEHVPERYEVRVHYAPADEVAQAVSELCENYRL
jgi:hypothetical protein